MNLNEVKDNLIVTGIIYLFVCFMSSIFTVTPPPDGSGGNSCKVDTPYKHIVYCQLFCPRN